MLARLAPAVARDVNNEIAAAQERIGELQPDQTDRAKSKRTLRSRLRELAASGKDEEEA